MEQNNTNIAASSTPTVELQIETLRDGLELWTGTAQIGRPQSMKIVPGYGTTSGVGYVEKRITSKMWFTKDGESIEVWVNFWDPVHVTLQKLINAGCTGKFYVNRAKYARIDNGTWSLNFNYRSQYEILRAWVYTPRNNEDDVIAAAVEAHQSPIR